MRYRALSRQMMSGANRLPGGVAVFAHVDGAGDVVALHGAFEGPANGVSGNLHVAVQLDLVGVNRALEVRVVDLAVLHSGEVVAALLRA